MDTVSLGRCIHSHGLVQTEDVAEVPVEESAKGVALMEGRFDVRI